MTTNTAVLKSDDKAEMQFVPFGGNDRIKLNLTIVKTLIAVKTARGETCGDRDAMRFMMLCQAQRLNPFAGDAYLVGYDGKTGPVFSLITAHQAFLKRAEVSPDYDGMISGIIIEGEDGQPKEVEGDFHMNGVRVLGGWAKVFHKKRTYPTYRKIRLERFDSGYAQWQKDPAGMICKCAEADALRSTFPTLLGGLYMEGETVNLPASRVTTDMPTSHLIDMAPQPEPKEAPAETPAKVQPIAPQEELADVVTGAGCTFENFMRWAKEAGHFPATAELDSFNEVKEADAKRFLRAKVGLLAALANMKAGAQ